MTGAALRRAIVIAAAAALAAAALLMPGPHRLVVRDGSGRIAASFPLRGEDAGFSLAWVHSVMLVPCVEYFRRGDNGTVELYRTKYKGLGAGLPYGDEGGVVTLEDGWIVIDGMRRTFPSITLLTSPVAPHTLGIAGRVYPVAGLLGSGHTAMFTIEKVPLGTRALAAAGIP